MTRTQTAILIIVAVLVLGFLAYVGVTQERPDEPEGAVDEEPAGEEIEGQIEGPVGEPGVVGGNPVTEEGKVVTEEGEPVDTSAEPRSPNAPRRVSVSEEDLSEAVIKLRILGNRFEPDEFEVKDGEAVTISLTSADDRYHTLKFTNPILKGVMIGVAPGKTGAMTFPAPEEEGEYEFFCDVVGHAQRGETGTMVVK